MSGPARYVIDASVGIKLVVEEPGTDRVEKLFRQASADADALLYVPSFFFVECASVLLKYVSRLSYPRPNAKRDLAALQSLNLTQIENTVVLDAAWEISIKHGVSVYDACYVAVSDMTGAPLLTEDKRLCERLKSTPHKLISLADLEL